VPIILPPEAASHHLIEPDKVVALRFELPLHNMVEGVAVKVEGLAMGVTVTVSEALELLMHWGTFHEIII